MDTIQVTLRDLHTPAKRLRREGIIPCDVYGGQLENSMAIQMGQRDAEALFRTKREGSTLYLQLDDKKLPVLVKEKKRDVISGRIEHLAFESLKAGVEVNSVAHILLENEDKCPGQVEQNLHEVAFTSLPRDLVDTITIDVAGKPEGTMVTVADLAELHTGSIRVKAEPETMVYRVEAKPIYEDEETAEA